jgi:hypothetical protein
MRSNGCMTEMNWVERATEQCYSSFGHKKLTGKLWVIQKNITGKIKNFFAHKKPW